MLINSVCSVVGLGSVSLEEFVALAKEESFDSMQALLINLLEEFSKEIFVGRVSLSDKLLGGGRDDLGDRLFMENKRDFGRGT